MDVKLIDISARLDAEHRAVFDALPREPRDWTDIPAVRAKFVADRNALPQPPLPPSVEISDRRVPGPAGAPDPRLRLYVPRTGMQPAALYWIHGGGTVIGDLEMNDHYCANIADQLGILVTSIEYRLAPEHPYPAGLEDCYAGLAWVFANVVELGLDNARIAVGGGSAGGLLAAALALLARDRGRLRPCFQLLVYPMLDDRNSTRSANAVTDPRVWDRASSLAAWDAYLEGEAGTANVPAHAAPARATDLAGLPPAYINVGDLDLFLDEDVAYAQALGAAGVPVELHVYPGAYHGSPGAVPAAQLSRRWITDELAALERALQLGEPKTTS
ncbi:MAG: alpha/beta hydrolase [Chloroflexi bacterium]|nr:alpha/beta hydrolase [Chloroflexota bacterium]